MMTKQFWAILSALFIVLSSQSQELILGLRCQIEHEEYTAKQALGLIGFDISAQYSSKLIFGELTLGPQNSYYRYHDPSGDARFYGTINRLRVGIGGGIYLIHKEEFKWSVYTSLLQGISFQKREVYSDLTMNGIYRMQIQPGIRFQIGQFLIGFHYGHNLVNEFSKRQQFILGGSLGIQF